MMDTIWTSSVLNPNSMYTFVEATQRCKVSKSLQPQPEGVIEDVVVGDRRQSHNRRVSSKPLEVVDAVAKRRRSYFALKFRCVFKGSLASKQQVSSYTQPIYKLHTYTGHNSHVIALDFHPKKTDLFCSCDVNGETRFWSSNPPYECSRVSKDALDTKLQARFQPIVGQFLALASNSVVSILDVETDKKITTIPGHNNELHSICWHANGDYLAVVSQDSVKVWSLASGKCIHELTSKGNNFRSSVFHSTYSNLLIVGGYQTLQLWNMAENQTMPVQAHTDLIAGLAYSSRGVLASVSHDNYVKIWK